jgi:hypothetical protein
VKRCALIAAASEPLRLLPWRWLCCEARHGAHELEHQDVLIALIAEAQQLHQVAVVHAQQ